MGAFLVYILKSSACVALFFLFYKLLLSGTTFHRLNRVTLLSLLLLSAILPLVYFTWEEGAIAESARPVNEAILFWAAQVESVSDVEREHSIPWPSIGAAVYLIGLVFFVVYGLVVGFALHRAIGREEARRFYGMRLVLTSRAVEPFSWSRTVVINREDFEREGKAVLAHEMAHVRFGHSADTLFVTLFCLAQWFNPAIWLLRRELREIHEFEADAAVLGEGIDPRDYQLRLIRKAVGSRRFTSMANSFNNNSLKKRIAMMLKRKSNPWGRLRYLSILPLAAIAVAAFAHPTIARKLEAISSSEFMELIPDEKQIIHEKAIAHAIAKDSVLAQVSERAQQIGDSISLIVAKHQPEIDRAIQEAIASAHIGDSISEIMERYQPEIDRAIQEAIASAHIGDSISEIMERYQPVIDRAIQEAMASSHVADSISAIMEQYRPEFERLEKEMEARQPEFERLQKEMEARQPEFERLEKEMEARQSEFERLQEEMEARQSAL